MHHIKPMITAQSGKRRQGKGFSPNEIKEAGLTQATHADFAYPWTANAKPATKTT